ncbi:MAG: sigma-70 family RNA polymerase sigma factor [Myxococcales bacterium]|nr:sigma-70 family RNA polymerase sigma factor [Myxococcales bacterium]
MYAGTLPLPGVASPDAEAALVRQLVDGDERAWRGLHRAHAADVYRVARRFVDGDAEAEEVVQEVFVAAFRYIDRFRGGSRLRTWLYRITVNRALKRRRWRTRRREVGPEDAERTAGHAITPEALAADRQALAVLQACLDRLEPRKRAVLVLHELEGLDTREIAEILQCPRSTVLTRLSRARQDLLRLAQRRGLRADDGGDA